MRRVTRWEEFKSWYSWKNEFASQKLLFIVTIVLLSEATGLSALAVQGSSQFFAIAFLIKAVIWLMVWQLLKLIGVLLVITLPNKLKGDKS